MSGSNLVHASRAFKKQDKDRLDGENEKCHVMVLLNKK